MSKASCLRKRLKKSAIRSSYQMVLKPFFYKVESAGEIVPSILMQLMKLAKPVAVQLKMDWLHKFFLNDNNPGLTKNTNGFPMDIACNCITCLGLLHALKDISRTFVDRDIQHSKELNFLNFHKHPQQRHFQYNALLSLDFLWMRN